MQGNVLEGILQKKDLQIIKSKGKDSYVSKQMLRTEQEEKELQEVRNKLKNHNKQQEIEKKN